MGAGSNLGEGLIFASFCLLKEGGIYPTGYPAEKLSYEGERMLWKNKAIYLVGYSFQDALDVLPFYHMYEFSGGLKLCDEMLSEHIKSKPVIPILRQRRGRRRGK